MLPLDLKIDKKGLLYTDDIELIRQHQLFIDNRNFKYERYYQNEFYPLPASSDYILKFSTTMFTRKQIKKIKEMLDILISKQKDIPEVDFPIAYFTFKRKLCGLIVKYYRDSISLDNAIKSEDIEELGKYFAHDEDSIHNLFLLFDKILDLEYKMFENGIYYRDINPGNIVLTNNDSKIIDFDYRFIRFDDKDCGLKGILRSYIYLLDRVLKQYHLTDGVEEELTNFETAKVFTKKLENNIRKGR